METVAAGNLIALIMLILLLVGSSAALYAKLCGLATSVVSLELKLTRLEDFKASLVCIDKRVSNHETRLVKVETKLERTA